MTVFHFQHVMLNLHMPACRKSNNKPTKMHWKSSALMVADKRVSWPHNVRQSLLCMLWPTLYHPKQPWQVSWFPCQHNGCLPCWTQIKPWRPQKSRWHGHCNSNSPTQLIIDTITNYYVAELWDLDECYNQSIFCDTIFHIFDCFALITEIMVDDYKAIFDQPMDVNKPLVVCIKNRNNANLLLLMQNPHQH